MITHSGIRVAPGTDTVPSPMDIAVQMARITRYGGALWCPLLAHSVLVAELYWRSQASKGTDFDFDTFCWSLLHDAHEVVTGEVPRPWKPKEMKDHQHELDFRIAKAFRLERIAIDTAAVKAADERALCIEAVVLGLPGFKEKYSQQDLKGDKFPELFPDEEDLGRAVMASEFRKVDVQHPALTRPVRMFAQVLEMVQTGDRVGAANVFRAMFERIVKPVTW